MLGHVMSPQVTASSESVSTVVYGLNCRRTRVFFPSKSRVYVVITPPLEFLKNHVVFPDGYRSPYLG